MSEGVITRQPWRGLISALIQPVRVATDPTTITGTGTVEDPLVGIGGSSENLVFNVKDYGATGNGTTDDTTDIQAAIAASSAAGGGVVYFPNGTYIVSDSGVDNAACLIVPSNTTLYGQSKQGAIIKLAAGQVASVRPILVGVPGGSVQISDVRIANLTIDGNKANQTVDEHRAGIFLYNSLRVVIEDMIIHGNSGDAIDIFLAVETIVQRCYCHDNDRKAISLDGGPTSYTWVRDCYFENNNGQLHIESQETVAWLWFEDSYCGEPSQGGFPVSMGAFGEHIYLRGLEILGGFQITNVSDCHVSDCHVVTGPQGAAGPAPLAISYDVFNVTVSNCVFEQQAAQGAENYIAVIESATAVTPSRPTNIILQNNTFTTVYGLANGISIVNVQDVQLIGNRITQTVASSGVGIGISATDSGYANPVVGTVILEGNYIEDWGTGIAVSGLDNTSYEIAALIANNNVIASGPTNTSKSFDLGPELPPPTSAPYDGLLQVSLVGNDSTGVTAEFASYPVAPILIGGVRGSQGIYGCAGSPNNQITENVGALAMQRDGSGSVVGWIKTSGADTDTGWQSINVT